MMERITGYSLHKHQVKKHQLCVGENTAIINNTGVQNKISILNRNLRITNPLKFRVSQNPLLNPNIKSREQNPDVQSQTQTIRIQRSRVRGQRSEFRVQSFRVSEPDIRIRLTELNIRIRRSGQTGKQVQTPGGQTGEVTGRTIFCRVRQARQSSTESVFQDCFNSQVDRCMQ